MKHLSHAFNQYVEDVGRRLSKPKRRFLRDLLFGMTVGRSTMLSEIGRALDEESDLIQTEKRLSRGLSSTRFDDDAVEWDYMDAATRYARFGQRPTIAVDDTDIAKPRARVMPFQSRIYDASEKRTANGWTALGVEAVWRDGHHVPLALRLDSTKCKDYQSPAQRVGSLVRRVRCHVHPESIWVFDRGYDSTHVLRMLMTEKVPFGLRIKCAIGQRSLFRRGKLRKISDLARIAHCKHALAPATPRRGFKQAKVGWVEGVYLPARTPKGHLSKKHWDPAPLNLVVLRNPWREQPLVLLTSVPVRTAKDALQVAAAYADRWGIEESFRFLKEELDLENIRALTWPGLRRLVMAAMLSYGFLAHMASLPDSVLRRVWKRFKAFGKMPRFTFYRTIRAVGKCLVRVEVAA